jgi:predicted TIM-barrel fold metal-dependent hydrolase
MSVVDACVHQWTLDYAEMSKIVPEPWSEKLAIKSKIVDFAAGTLMSTLPWYHAYWNEDAPIFTSEVDEVDPEAFRSPAPVETALADQDVDKALLLGHEVRFLPTIVSPDFASVVASAYNELLAEQWLEVSDLLKGAILVPMNNPEAAVEEIEAYADHPDMVTVLTYGGWDLPFGHSYYEPIFEAVSESGLPLTIHTSGNPMHRQTAMGIPEHFVTYDTNLFQNHMTNLVSMIFQGVFERYPNLSVVWAGEGPTWALHAMWRSTRYYRNFEPQVPVTLKREPKDQVREQCFFTTFPRGELKPDAWVDLYDLVGAENILYGSGYPDWNADEPCAFDALPQEDRNQVLSGTAETVYGL